MIVFRSTSFELYAQYAICVCAGHSTQCIMCYVLSISNMFLYKKPCWWTCLSVEADLLDYDVKFEPAVISSLPHQHA